MLALASHGLLKRPGALGRPGRDVAGRERHSTCAARSARRCQYAPATPPAGCGGKGAAAGGGSGGASASTGHAAQLAACSRGCHRPHVIHGRQRAREVADDCGVVRDNDAAGDVDAVLARETQTLLHRFRAIEPFHPQRQQRVRPAGA